MRTFYITLAIVVAWVAWQLNKPIPKKQQVARAFTDAEVEYLEKTFDYAMDNLKAGEHMDWSAAAVNGRIAAGAPYTSKQKADCRNYVEVARTYNAQKVESGIACKRSGKEGWCRLHMNDAESCALEVAESSLIKRARFAILQGNQIIDKMMGTRVEMDTNGLVPSMPSVRTPDMPSVEMPHIEQPDAARTIHSILPWNNPKQ